MRRLCATLLPLLAFTPSAHAQPLFQPSYLMYSTGWPGFGAVAMADLNGDGHQDLAVSARESNKVSVMLLQGDGTFLAGASFDAGPGPEALAIADLDRDGRPDVVTVNPASNTISVLYGIGGGLLASPINLPTGIRPVALAIADLNGDQYPDVVVANNVSNYATLLLGGAGGLTQQGGISTGTAPSSLAITDLNGDGRPDLLVANRFSGTVWSLLGNGNGSFTFKAQLATAAGPAVLATADLNEDGAQDLLVGCNTGNLSTLLGHGDGTFADHTDQPIGVRSMALVDMDRDGHVDLVSCDGTYFVSMRMGAGTGAFGAAQFFQTQSPEPYLGSNESLVVGSLNSDAWPDIAALSVFFTGFSSYVSVMRSQGVPLPPVVMGLEIEPGTLHLGSRGRWVTGYLEAGAPLAPGDIDVGSIRLNDVVPVDPSAPTSIGDHDGDGLAELAVKFDRVAVGLTLDVGDAVPVLVTGTAAGQPFTSVDYIRVVRGVVLQPWASSRLAPGSVTAVVWQAPGSGSVESVDLRLSTDGGSTWSVIAGGLPNTGHYDWTVPEVHSEQVRIAVVAEPSPPPDDDAGEVLARSDAFAIAGLVGVEPRPGATALAIRPSGPNPSPGPRLWVEFSLPGHAPALLELHDVSGRLLTRREVGSLGPGTHVLDLSEGLSLPSGVYFLRLTQAGQEVRTRAAMLR